MFLYHSPDLIKQTHNESIQLETVWYESAFVCIHVSPQKKIRNTQHESEFMWIHRNLLLHQWSGVYVFGQNIKCCLILMVYIKLT